MRGHFLRASLAGAVGGGGYDADAAAYIAAVEDEDGQSLEVGVADAINDFVVGCKDDGIWAAIMAACILAAARTLDGALVPLVGPAPTSFNFVSGDYNRKTGLVGNGSTKYLNANRAGNADPQNSYHLAVYRAATQGNGSAQIEAGYGDTGTGASSIFRGYTTPPPTYLGTYARCRSSSPNEVNATAATIGLHGISRSASGIFIGRANSTDRSISQASQSPGARATLVFTRSQSSSDSPAGFYSASRLSFYSIGEALDLALLDARVTTLMTDIAAAIP
jgi:hypothetical protein